MVNKKDHEKIQEILESVAKESEYMQIVESHDEFFDIYVTSDAANDSRALELAVQEIEASEVGDSRYEIDGSIHRLDNIGEIRVVCPARAEHKQRTTDAINHYLNEFDDSTTTIR